MCLIGKLSTNVYKWTSSHSYVKLPQGNDQQKAMNISLSLATSPAKQFQTIRCDIYQIVTWGDF